MVLFILLLSIGAIIGGVRLAVRIIAWVRKHRADIAELGVGFMVQDAFASWATDDDGSPPSPGDAAHAGGHHGDGAGSHSDGGGGGTLSL
ncbi:MAG: hypothetical protein JNM17_37145 [Archangium sp.]|nr:hypothetical protein [Archangium sp.]